MNRGEYADKEPFSVPQKTKEEFYREEIGELSEYHRKACQVYDDICNGLREDCPRLPVTIFKDVDLKSVPDDAVIRRITSSGTTGQQVSRIYLDAETSAAQQRALCTITGDFIGGRRIPMLIIDSPDVLRDRSKFTARGAGILGFSMMASKRIYALDDNMEIDIEAVRQFEELTKGGPTFAFGFTYMIWEYFYGGLRAKGIKPELKGCHLIHGGGWKKLADRKVSDDEFKAGLKETCGIDSVSDYYGMAEQTGSIFMQCSEGHLHASTFSDISMLRPEDFSECEVGEWGLAALDSIIPKSYPGHRLLTEDWGRLLGTDDCPCGRKGRYFEIGGRISKAEVRGCSDTFGSAAPSGEFEVYAGAYPPEAAGDSWFSDNTKAFLNELSKLFTKTPEYRQYPEIYALGFWCRSAHIQKIEERQKAGGSGERKGRGLVLHIAPSNMPTMFAYSWISSLLAGNSNVVRVSQKDSEITRAAIAGIRVLLDKPEYEYLKKTNAFVSFPRGDKALEEISGSASARMIWGGDETVRSISGTPKQEGCTDIAFPDKYSVALLRTSDLENLDDAETQHLAHLFYNDTYGADQNACSSPKTVFWLDNGKLPAEQTKNKWWKAVQKEAGGYDLQPWIATEKYRMLCRTYASCKGLEPAERYGNRLYVIPLAKTVQHITDYDGRFGMFYEMDIGNINEMLPYMEEKIQTIVASGADQDAIYKAVRDAGCEGVDRVTAIGEALDFDTVWDRKDLIDILSV